LSMAWHTGGPAREPQREQWKRSATDHRALAQSAGPIADRTREHLGTSDKAVVAFRQRLLGAARRLAEGLEPQAPYDPDCYRVRAHAGLVPRDERDFTEQEEIRRAMLAP
jgi:LigXa C-terminal domain like